MLINELSHALIKQREDPRNAFCVLEDKFGGGKLDHAGADGDTDHGAKAKGIGFAGPFAGGVREGSGDPYGSVGEQRIAQEATTSGEGLCHGDEEEPFSVGDILHARVLAKAAGGGVAQEEGAELAEDVLPVLLLLTPHP